MIDIPSYSISNGSSMKQCMCYASDTYVPVEMMMLLTITKGKQSNQGSRLFYSFIMLTYGTAQMQLHNSECQTHELNMVTLR